MNVCEKPLSPAGETPRPAPRPNGKCLFSVVIIATFLATVARWSWAEAKVARTDDPSFTSVIDLSFRPFRLDQVQLLEGRAQDELETNRKYLHAGAPRDLGNLNFDARTVLHLFRKTAGLPAPGDDMGHTESVSENRARGQFSGHLLSAFAMTYAATGDPVLKQRSDEILAGLADVQQSYGDGYLSAWPKSIWDEVEDMQKYCHAVPYYCQHKLMAGLWDQYAIAGDVRALEILTNCAAWFAARYKKQSPELIHYVQHKFENGGMGEMYFNLYGQTANKDFLRAGLAMGKPDWVARLANREDEAICVHGNVHLPLVIGMARHHELTGDARSRAICEFFWDRVANTRSYATGGSTVSEGWGKANDLAGTLCESTIESCTVYNMLRLTRHLLCWTGGVEYGDYYERNYYNHILGSMGTNGAIKTYNQSLASGSYKLNHGPTSCCYGTGMESFAKLADSIYFHSDKDLYVNLYIASVLDWRARGFKLTQDTTFPETDRITFKIEARSPTAFALNFRVPYWATKGIRVSVNGQAVKTDKARPVSWFKIEREWRTGDTVELCLPMSLHYRPMPDDKNLVALMYGPLVLAGGLDERDFVEREKVTGRSGTFSLKGRLMDELVPAGYYFTGDLAQLDSWIKPVAGKALAFRAVGQPQDVTLVPYNVFHPRVQDRDASLIDAQGYDWNRKTAAGPAATLVMAEDVARRFAVYWLMASDPKQPRLTAVKEAHAGLLDLKARLVDLVYPRHETERVAYRRVEGKGIDYGSYCGWVNASARGEGWFSWDLKVLPGTPMSLGIFHTCRIFKPASALMGCNNYWEADFDILVEDRVVATSKPNAVTQWEHYVEFKLPHELTSGREKITVKFKPRGNGFARVYGCTTTRSKN